MKEGPRADVADASSWSISYVAGKRSSVDPAWSIVTPSATTVDALAEII